MGYIIVDNLDVLMLKTIYKKGKVSIAELIGIAQKRSETVHLGSHDYSDSNTLSIMFEMCLKWHSREWDEKTEGILIEPILEDENDEFIFNQWSNDNLSLKETKHNAAFLKLKWKFAKNGRHKYIKESINILYEYKN